jgi:DNA repair photolyase
VRLPGAVAGLFQDWLERHYPDRKTKVLDRIRTARGGRLNEVRFGKRMSGEGNHAELFARLFRSASRRAGLNQSPWPVSPAAFRRPGLEQLTLFS